MEFLRSIQKTLRERRTRRANLSICIWTRTSVMFLFSSDWNYSINAKTFDELDVALFRNYRFGTLFNYIFLTWGLTILKFALLVADIYTCIKLLAFNSWSNNIIKPYLPFHISKWLFSGCILAYIILALWDSFLGIRIYRSRNISLVYINNFAKTMYSLSNYSIFCVLDRITPKGFYQRIAFFTFFELKDCFKLLFTDTPRQVINGLTLWSVLVTVNSSTDLGNLETFNGLIMKIKIIAKTNHEEAVVLSFMLFSFIVWLIFITKLAFAMLFSIFVYYKLINEHKYNGLREFVCVTIRQRVDAIVEKQRKIKRKGNGPYANGIQMTSTTSFFPTEDLERKAAPVSITNAFKDSSIALLDHQDQNKNSRISSTASDNYDTDGLEEKASEDFGVKSEPLKMVSAINTTFDRNEKPSYSVFNPKESACSRELFNTDSTDTLPSYHLKEYASRDTFNRPRPPMIETETFLTDSTAADDTRHIDTPIKAYTREWNNPERSTSILERRERIANEDYSHFIHKHEHK